MVPAVLLLHLREQKANKKNFIFLLMKSLKLEKAVYIHQVTMI